MSCNIFPERVGLGKICMRKGGGGERVLGVIYELLAECNQ